jgi:hypothetical protein
MKRYAVYLLLLFETLHYNIPREFIPGLRHSRFMYTFNGRSGFTIAKQVQFANGVPFNAYWPKDTFVIVILVKETMTKLSK